MYSVFRKRDLFRTLGIGICTVLSACDASKSDTKQHHSVSSHSANEITAQRSSQESAVQDGKKLTELAGQATLPETTDVHDLDQPSEELSHKAQAFVGRYYTQMSCEDPFAMCDKGSAEFIINLLADGTAHRNFAYVGKMSNENKDIQAKRSYQKNTWVYDEQNHEIIIQRPEGLNFYYKIDSQKNLVMDLDRTFNGTDENKLFFQQNDLAPTKAYVLTKLENEH